MMHPRWKQMAEAEGLTPAQITAIALLEKAGSIGRDNAGNVTIRTAAGGEAMTVPADSWATIQDFRQRWGTRPAA